MILRIPIKPIIAWPGRRNQNPINSPFRATCSQTLKLIDKELNHAKAVDQSWFIEMFVRPEDIRRDGELRANAKPPEPGIIFTFERFTEGRKTQSLSFPCDRFNSWKDNLRAIALSMQSLRQVERYGVFKYADIINRLALPVAGEGVARFDCAKFIADHSDFQVDDILSGVAIEVAYKRAARKLHPDNQETGNDALFVRLIEAKRVLDLG